MMYLSRQAKITISKNGGFTLLELALVAFLLGILASLALPVIFAQVGRAREAEGKQILSAIAFSQQGYFFEHAQFANNYDDLGVTFQSNYYTISLPDNTVSSTVSKVQAESINGQNTNTRSFGMGVYYESLSYKIALCRSQTPATQTVAPDVWSGNCSNNGTKEE
ncbi:MAG: type IV pilin-like G/H family protein [Nostocales cyanobacterium 94392]|nr:type IV pilin-like G/H family protein [Nostocales cyanobacterium 94392]